MPDARIAGARAVDDGTQVLPECDARGGIRAGDPSTFASPQSMTSTSPKSPSMMFSGFRSRWMTPLLCAKAMASQTFWKMVSSAASGYFFTVSATPCASSSSTFFSVMPRTIFIV